MKNVGYTCYKRDLNFCILHTNKAFDFKDLEVFRPYIEVFRPYNCL